MTRRKNPDSVLAAALVSADGEGDDKAARRFGLDTSDIIRARRRSITDETFRGVVISARKYAERVWRVDLASTTSALARELTRRSTDPESASTIELIASLRASVQAIVSAQTLLMEEGLDDDDDDNEFRPRAQLLPRGER